MEDLKFRKMDLNEKVSIELPAHAWLGFLFAYASSDWSDMCANRMSEAVQEALLDPLYLKERQAQQQAHADMHNAAFAQMTGQKIEVPPNITDFTGFIPEVPEDPTTEANNDPNGE